VYCFGIGGLFSNGFGFMFMMGVGIWVGNSILMNLFYWDFFNFMCVA